MRNRNDNSVRVGTSFADLLTILFIALKLLGKIDWPWIWVVSPIWVTLLVMLLVIVVVIILDR